MDDPVERLTEGQRECLRRVLRHMSSKEIARELGISSHTVDQRVRIAMQTLGASTRVEAARMLAARETPAYQSSVYQPLYIAPTTLPNAASLRDEEGRRDERGGDIGRSSTVGQTAEPAGASSEFPLPLPVRGGQRNDLGPWQRLGWIVAIAIGTALAFGAVLAGLEALGQLAQR